MTKKKLQGIILLCVLLLFCCAEAMNYMSALNYVEQNIGKFWNSNNYIYDQISEFEQSEEKDLTMLHHKLSYYTPANYTFSDLPYAYGMIDREGNIIFKSGSGVWWHDEQNEYNYISLEGYLTSEIKRDIMKFKRQSGHGNLLVEEVEIYTSYGFIAPVSITLYDQNGNYRKFRFSHTKPTLTISEEQISRWIFYDLNEKSPNHRYYEKITAEVEEMLKSYEFDENSGGGGFRSAGYMYWDYCLDGYYYAIVSDYSSFFTTVTSSMFLSLTVYTLILFTVATVLILIVATRMYNKNLHMREEKRAFTSAAAHELKTPLAVIQNQCECVLDEIAPEKNKEYVSSIYDEALRMNEIVKTLLTFNRLSDTERIEKTHCNLTELVKNEIKKYDNFAKGKDINITLNIEEDIFTECNEDLIAMAVDNYLSNAFKYASGKKQVEISLKKQGKEFVFEVYNDGENIPLRLDVWHLLTRADTARNSADGSTGMGLPICKRIFDLHGYGYKYFNTTEGVRFEFRGKYVK